MSPVTPSKSPPPAARGNRPPALSFHESQDRLLYSSAAPTPNNTVSPADTFASRPWRVSRGASEATSVITEGEEMMYGQRPDVSIGYSQGSPLSSHHLRPASPLVSSGTGRMLPWGSTLSQSSEIPFSNVPIPAPPRNVSPKSPTKAFDDPDDIKSVLSAPETPSVLVGPVTFADEGDRDGRSPDTESSRISWSSKWRGRRKGRTLTQADVDARRLQQLGYDPVLGRDYTFWSSLCISTLNIGCIQGTIYAVGGAYQYGGPRMILIMWPVSGVFAIFLTLTLAELASAYPVAGAMASWAWKAARGGVGHERGWAWLMGGAVMGGHIASALLVTIELAQVIEGTMSLSSTTYEATTWQSILFFIAIFAVCGVVGSRRWGRSHYFWLCAGCFGAGVWLVLCISLLATGAKKHPSNLSSAHFTTTTGWTSKPYVYLLGWALCTIAAGADASAHMAEETQNPSRNVPNAMVGSMVITYVCGYISIVLLLISIPPEDAAAIANTDFAVGYILTQAINKSGAIAICCLLIITMTLQILAQLQASSRFVFALARDHAMPFSEYIQHTNSAKMPIVAHWLVIALCVPFCLLSLSSNSVLFSVLAVSAGALSYLGYVVPAALYLFSKLNLQQEGRTSWSLRSFSRPVAVVGVLYGLAVIFVAMIPNGYPVTAETISWSPVVLVGTIITCSITWKLYGSRHYSGPIRALTKWETGVEIDLQTTLQSGRSKPTDPENTNFTPHLYDSTGGEISGVPIHVKGDILGDDNVVHTVTVQSAKSLEELEEDYEGGEWTTATSSGGMDLERGNGEEEIRQAAPGRR